ncbi:hypothetical protein Tco_0164148 [Tanacetum coccineum]
MALLDLSVSPWGSARSYLLRRGWRWRLCIDYRELTVYNSNAILFAYRRFVLTNCNGARYFSKIDMQIGDHQASCERAVDFYERAFSYCYGHYEFFERHHYGSIKGLKTITNAETYYGDRRSKSAMWTTVRFVGFVQNVEDGKIGSFSVDDDGVVVVQPKSSKLNISGIVGLLQPLEISFVTMGEISMDFVTGLPTTQKRHDAILGCVDRDRSLRIVLEKDYRKLGNFILSSGRIFVLGEFAYNNSCACLASKADTFRALVRQLIEIIMRKCFCKGEIESRLDRDRTSFADKLIERGKLSHSTFIGRWNLERIGEVSIVGALASGNYRHVHDVFNVFFEGIPLLSIACRNLIPSDQIQPDLSLFEES